MNALCFSFSPMNLDPTQAFLAKTIVLFEE